MLLEPLGLMLLEPLGLRMLESAWDHSPDLPATPPCRHQREELPQAALAADGPAGAAQRWAGLGWRGVCKCSRG